MEPAKSAPGHRTRCCGGRCTRIRYAHQYMAILTAKDASDPIHTEYLPKPPNAQIRLPPPTVPGAVGGGEQESDMRPSTWRYERQRMRAIRSTPSPRRNHRRL